MAEEQQPDQKEKLRKRDIKKEETVKDVKPEVKPEKELPDKQSQIIKSL